MPFMRGMMPLRRTLFFLRQGKIKFRDEVKIFIISYHHRPNPAQQGTKDFIFWHWAQLIFKNPQIQFLKYDKMSVNPFALAFLRDGREVPFDLEWKTQEEIEQMFLSTLGNTALVQKRDHMVTLLKNNPADFGINCKRQCICEVQGQHPCTSLLTAPKYAQGSWRWDHSNYKERPTYPANKHLAEIEEANVDRDHPDFYP